jgi:protein LTV1
MVFTEVADTNKKQKRAKTRHDLEQELHLDAGSIRRNEGEAANYGVFFDDTAYDYMQHIRDIGADGEGYFIEAVPGDDDPKKGKGKGRGKGKQQTLDEALRDTSLEDLQRPDPSENGDRGNASVAGVSEGGGVRLDPDILPSAYVRNNTYQDQQDVPDALAGFQPDMDPRLREVLEALEDDAYVADDAEEDTFAELASGDSRELSLDEFEHYADATAEDEMDRDNGGEEEDDGWETDDTAKPGRTDTRAARKPTMDGDVAMEGSTAAGEPSDNNWMAEYNKYKRAGRGRSDALATEDMTEEGPRTGARRGPGHATSNAPSSSGITGSSYLAGGRRKKRKGAMTSSTSYSMSSSSILRTEGLTLLDDRFEQVCHHFPKLHYVSTSFLSLFPHHSGNLITRTSLICCRLKNYMRWMKMKRERKVAMSHLPRRRLCPTLSLLPSPIAPLKRARFVQTWTL